jgi:sterol desaturase/sphingolipid hydroxylase (fatty acid hydroxylase superfamily)
MPEAQLQVVRVAGFLAALVLALLLQRLAPHSHVTRSWRVNAGLWLLDAIIVGAVCGACAFTVAAWAAREGIGLLNQVELGTLGSAAMTVAALDLVSYAWHRMNHRIPLLWRLHQVHHSDPGFAVSTGLRFHPGELLLSLPIRLAAVLLLGAPVRAVLAFEIAFTCANLIEHGDIALPDRLERSLSGICITPALHRRHHTKVGPERDTNFGTIFSAWDRLFGTYTASGSATRVETGLPGMGDPPLSRLLVLPLRRPAS